MAGSGIDRKTFWNVVAVAGLLVILLTIGVFVVKTMTMNDDPDPTAGPTVTFSPVTITAQPSPVSTPTALANVTGTPTPSTTITPTAAPYSTPTPTPAPTLTPTPEPTPYPTQPPQVTPTPTPTPPPVQNIPDAPFYESITPLKDKDQFSLAPVQNSYIAGNGPLYLDLDHSYMGSGYAYPGDTLGVMLKMYNDGPALDTSARVTMDLQMRIYGGGYGTYWSDPIISQEAFTPIAIGEKASFTKNLSYAVPNTSGFKGFYKITVKYYVNGQFNCGFIKELNILDA